jgi:hypothetical protein
MPNEDLGDLTAPDPQAVRGENPRPVAGSAISTSASERVIMSDKSPHKANAKKLGKTLKEKRAAKRTKRIKQAGKTSNIPPTGH